MLAEGARLQTATSACVYVMIRTVAWPREGSTDGENSQVVTVCLRLGRGLEGHRVECS